LWLRNFITRGTKIFTKDTKVKIAYFHEGRLNNFVVERSRRDSRRVQSAEYSSSILHSTFFILHYSALFCIYSLPDCDCIFFRFFNAITLCIAG